MLSRDSAGPASPSTGVNEQRRQGFDVQESLDGSKYEGEFLNGLKHGKGRYTSKSGEFYEGSFYKDYRHGDGVYCWPSGHKFIGKFYLNWREGYGQQLFPDGATFKGLYHADQRFGPGVLSKPSGHQDVGLWHGKHLLQLCNSVQDSFSLKNFEYADYLDETTAAPCHIQVNCHNEVIQLLLDMGADIDRANSEGMTALSVCHVLYYPFQSLCTLAGLVPKTQISPVDSSTDYTNGIRGKVRTSLEEGAVEMRDFFEAEGSGCDEREKGEGEVLLSQLSVQVMDEHIVLGSVKWKGYPSGNVQHDCNDEAQAQSFPSTCSVYSFNINVTGEVLQEAAEALSQTGFCQDADTQDTVRRMAAIKFMHRLRLTTLNLLLDQGADPNICRVPLPVLFLAIMAADTETVKKLLLCGARTNIALPPKRKGFYPLHVAAALPGPEGPKITKLLLQINALTNPDARACDQDDIYELDRLSLLTRQSWRRDEKPCPKEGGQTALHIACQRDTDHCNASKVVSLLLSYNASTDFLWSGHSPLSLAIASGNNMAVEELLKVGADPNLPLGRGVGSALCALGNSNYHLDDDRPKLLDILEKAGADILMPVHVGDNVGTAVDYAHQSFNQDSGIAHTPYHALSMEEREVFKIRRQLLSMMANLLRRAAAQREREQLEMEECLRSPSFKFCYHCGRSATVKLTACTRCRKVFYCSITCKLKAWAEKHKEECLRESGAAYNFDKRVMFQTEKGRKGSSVLLSRRPFHVQFKSNVLLIGDNISEWQSINVKENYSYN
uniref:ankyrin repeat and MYND domain-containing protein 1-like isoform X2 n=1 Tax=Doryrhamphus excisus TaxID=161450 RepID=UPI0025ADAB4F|nr:ankyrin repeat and MYND domain-containing protein 1-like isoform X2 [Doryrhamphus excisus]